MFADLNPCGFYLYGTFKDKVSSNNPCTENNFKKDHLGCSVFSFFSKTWMCNNQHVWKMSYLFVGQRNPFQPPSLNMVGKNLILTTLQWTKTFQCFLQINLAHKSNKLALNAVHWNKRHSRPTSWKTGTVTILGYLLSRRTSWVNRLLNSNCWNLIAK